MAKRSKKNKENNEIPTNTTPTPANEPVVTPTEPEVTIEAEIKEPEVATEPEITVESEIDAALKPNVTEVPETPKAETKKEKVKSAKDIFHANLEEPVEHTVEQPVSSKKTKDLSARQMFEKAIETKPFTIFQNGILVCHHSDFVKIIVTDKYFEISFRKFSYDGIEIKYI